VWLFGPGTDAAAFVGSVLLAALVAWGARAGLGASGEAPLWAWVLFVVALDVGHVWGTLFRTYLDPAEVARRPVLLLGAPLLVWAAGVCAHLHSAALFWRLLAYGALFHFVRQQAGWMALYGRRGGAPAWERRLDAAAIYAATLGPALWWHARLPRPFWWFVPGDFAPLPAWVGPLALGAHAALLALWAVVQLGRWAGGRGVQAGKALLLAGTWGAWGGGIVLARDDLTFTLMNVTPHAVPYLVLLARYVRGRAEEEEEGAGRFRAWARAGLPGLLAFVGALALLEELLWDRLVWHERPELFGGPSAGAGAGGLLPEEALAWVVPLLALPQATHYVLDAFVWRASGDAQLLARLGWAHRLRPAADGAVTPRLSPPAVVANVPPGPH
jgi:hypothetical protein